jgi:hypothetical protein
MLARNEPIHAHQLGVVDHPIARRPVRFDRGWTENLGTATRRGAARELQRSEAILCLRVACAEHDFRGRLREDVGDAHGIAVDGHRAAPWFGGLRECRAGAGHEYPSRRRRQRTDRVKTLEHDF